MGSNSGKPWSTDQEKRLKHMLLHGASFNCIAEKLGSTPWAIEVRAQSMGLISPSGEIITNEKPASFDINPNTNAPKQQEQGMKLFKVEQVTRINGQDADQLKDDVLIEYISNLEDQIERLESIKVASEAIHSKIDELRDNARDIANILDERHKADATVR